MRVYIAGPMTGHKHYNVDAFEQAACRWECAGDYVVTPFEANSRVWRRHYGRAFDPRNDVCDWGDPILPEMLAEDLKVLCMSDKVALLPGWEKSKGARAEILIAFNLGKKFYDAITFEQLHLEAAAVIVNRGVK